MTANIEIRGETRDQVLTVPVESVFIRGDEEMVYVKRDVPLPKEGAESAGDEVHASPASEEAPADTETSDSTADEEDWREDPRQEWRRWFEERRVVTGISSTTDVEILEGLDNEEPVALADPSRPPEESS